MARILVAEDERSLAEFIRVTLDDEGHELVVVADGSEALRSLQNDGPFDLLVLDLMMPRVDGFGVLTELGASRPPVIVLTARDDAPARDRLDAFGVEGYLAKPYDPWQLATMVREVLSGGDHGSA